VLSAIIALAVGGYVLIRGYSREQVLLHDSIVSMRDQFPWNVVQPDDPWFPALSHPGGPQIITSVLTDWLGRIDEDLNGDNRHYAHPPDISQVRLLRFQLPSGFVPIVHGARFALQDQKSNNRDDALMGHAPGDFGLRFDWFEPQDDNSVLVVMCLLQYANRPAGVIDAYSLRYRVRKEYGQWIAELESISS
jgi:hypothetical protein